MNVPEMDFSRLCGRIREKVKTQEALADAIGISRTSLFNKMTNKVSWTSREIYLVCQVLDIPLKDAPSYFFIERSC